MIPVNRKVGKFEILRKLARGGMADVYLGRDEDTGVTLALKLIEQAPERVAAAVLEQPIGSPTGTGPSTNRVALLGRPAGEQP